MLIFMCKYVGENGQKAWLLVVPRQQFHRLNSDVVDPGTGPGPVVHY